ncbi:MAG: hypothetical protein K2Y37_18470 [Pirellulales bacterium]|nr:hypothetical protein [Pirellulales bacterium]
MKHSLAVIRGIFWPPAAPIASNEPASRAWWGTLCVLLVIPFTALLHHAVFFRPTCMLNHFNATDYNIEGLRLWLSGDPSLYVAIVAAVLVWLLGRRWEVVRLLTAPFFLSFIPLSLWIWDIPGSGRLICRLCHDGRVVLPVLDHTVRSRDLYLVGIAAYVVLLGLTLSAWRKAPSSSELTDELRP